MDGKVLIRSHKNYVKLITLNIWSHGRLLVYISELEPARDISKSK